LLLQEKGVGKGVGTCGKREGVVTWRGDMGKMQEKGWGHVGKGEGVVTWRGTWKKGEGGSYEGRDRRERGEEFKVDKGKDVVILILI
jgi:hypothetical protein